MAETVDTADMSKPGVAAPYLPPTTPTVGRSGPAGFAPPAAPPTSDASSLAPPVSPAPAIETVPTVGAKMPAPPDSFAEIRAVHAATTRQLRERRSPSRSGRVALLSIGVVTTLGALAILIAATMY